MSAPRAFARDRARAGDILQHLQRCDADFVPPLSQRVALPEYSAKLAAQALRFEAWDGDVLAGLVAIYLDPATREAYVSSVSVLRECAGRGLATQLLGQAIAHARAAGMQAMRLQVAAGNPAALRLYDAHGFTPAARDGGFVTMTLDLQAETP